jgi:hypothetical protein
VPSSKQRKRKPTARRTTSRHRQGASAGTPSGRYTPPSPQIHIRPTWHRLVGILLLVAAVALFFTNDFVDDALPGGHSEAYFMLSLLLAAYGAWWFGVFDRTR